MKVALVHDYIRDFGGAERVLKTLSEMYPDAPIYTAFYVKNSTAYKEFKSKKLVESAWAPLIKYFNLYSPLRFLLPSVWGSLDLSKYDLVITSCSNYVARGFKVSPKTKVVVYCHTPPRFLYGYQTGDLQKFWPIKMYANIIAHFLRQFDFKTAQKINYWIVNSKNIQERVKKFYKKDSTIIYPPIEYSRFSSLTTNHDNYFLIVSRIVGTKGIVEAAQVANQLGINLKIVGEGSGILSVEERLKKYVGKNVQLLGRVSDDELINLYAKAKGFIALARDEDFGMTVVEAQAAGTPIIAFRGGGFKESVIEDTTGVFVEDTDIATLQRAFKKFNKIKWDREKIKKNAKRFSRENFEKEIFTYINQVMNVKKY
ncbi:glycosyltransferase [Candidatus Microgenomates bacterium]|nr:glycosyltransferase [Candidatus Microgenomates bacterium]